MTTTSALLCFSLLVACNHAGSLQTPEKHLVMLARPGSSLYLDRASNRMVMQEDSSADSHFCSFQVGWADSLPDKDKKASIAKERYFQYNMQGDWKALINGDSLQVVFFQEKPSLQQEKKEAVMVFETPGGQQPDTLVYRDSFGSWGTQIFVVNNRK